MDGFGLDVLVQVGEMSGSGGRHVGEEIACGCIRMITADSRLAKQCECNLSVLVLRLSCLETGVVSTPNGPFPLLFDVVSSLLYPFAYSQHHV
jgi:hypothetical protein